MAGQIEVRCFPALDLELIQAADIIHHLSRHVHNTLCIGIIEQGARECLERGAKRLAVAGQIVIVNPGEIHACAAGVGKSYSYRMLCLDAAAARRLCRQLTGLVSMPYFTESIVDDRLSFANIVKLADLLSRTSARLERETLLMEMFAGLMRHAADKPKFEDLGREDSMVRQLCEYVEAHCTEEISLNRLSGLVNFSPFYLHHAFTAQVGLPLHAYQTLKRVNRAKNLLVQGKSLVMAAAETGFVDQSHFSRRFKDTVGLPPGQWLRARMAN